MDTAIFLLLSCAVLLSLSNVQGHSLNENKVSVAQGNLCDVKKEVSELKELMVNVTKDLHEMRNEFGKEIHEMRNEFGKEIKAMWKYLKEEKSSKNVSTDQPKNKCSADALYFRGGNTIEYAKYENSTSRAAVPDKELNAITSCFWIKTQKRSEEPTVLSYAVPDHYNELTVYVAQTVKVFVKCKMVNLGIWVSDGKWHHVCITWESSYGALQAYKDGVLINSRTGFEPGKRILPFGIWFIGQDQDTFGGGFELKDAFQGSLTEVNVWDRVLDASEISTLANSECGLGMKGNYRAYNDFVPYGGVRKYKPSCCQQ